MSDQRLTPDPVLVTMGYAACIAVPVSGLNRSPDGPRDRQLIYGDVVTVLNEADGWCYVQAAKDGYCGHVAAKTLGAPQAPTHRVIAPATHAYAAPDLKSPDTASLSFGSQLTVTATTGHFAQTPIGYIPTQHVAPVSTQADDPATVAALFLGTPYLWGGNSRWGIDCSGLIQAALLSCGIPCPGDSDQQQSLGQAASGPYLRNDLLFWKGHVALVTDLDTLIHANAGSMSTRYEGIKNTIARIQASGDGPITAHRRL
jgi:cell wall-associated NlpC family hydrolase